MFFAIFLITVPGGKHLSQHERKTGVAPPSAVSLIFFVEDKGFLKTIESNLEFLIADVQPGLLFDSKVHFVPTLVTDRRSFASVMVEQIFIKRELPLLIVSDALIETDDRANLGDIVSGVTFAAARICKTIHLSRSRIAHYDVKSLRDEIVRAAFGCLLLAPPRSPPLSRRAVWPERRNSRSGLPQTREELWETQTAQGDLWIHRLPKPRGDE